MNKSTAILAILFYCTFLGGTIYAQVPGGMSPPDFNAEKAAGIIKYDIKKVVKKLKIDDEATASSVVNLLTQYNAQMEEISLNHAAIFRELETAFDKNIQLAMQRRDQSVMTGFKNQLKEVLPPIRKSVMEQEKELNSDMAEVLSEKQNDKWLKYQKQQKEDSFNFPQT